MSDTGGGHRASAEAVAEAVATRYPGQYQLIIEDVWKHHVAWPLNYIPDAYRWITGPGLRLWDMLWHHSRYAGILRLILTLTQPFVVPTMSRYVRQIEPQLVVSVHPLLNHLGLKALRASGVAAPFITIITDLITIHPAWVCPEVAACFVPTNLAAEQAIGLGMPVERLAAYGQPVSLKFTQCQSQESTGDKAALRRRLNLCPDAPTLLIIGGGEGIGRIEEIARHLETRLPQAQLIIVTGRNQSLRERLNVIPWKIPTRVYGFVDNMHELMLVADLLITKAGPVTLSEAFMAGLPSIIFGYIPGQETCNVAYVAQHQAGVYAEDPAEIAQIAAGWLIDDPARSREMGCNAARLAQPHAATRIAQALCRYVERI